MYICKTFVTAPRHTLFFLGFGVFFRQHWEETILPVLFCSHYRATAGLAEGLSVPKAVKKFVHILLQQENGRLDRGLPAIS